MFAELQEPSFYQIVQFFQGTAGGVLFCETRGIVMEVPGPKFTPSVWVSIGSQFLM